MPPTFPNFRLGAVAQNIDEISMLAPNKLHQLDQRARQATMRFEEAMGGLATNGSVDFLQLPPVDTPSLAMPLEREDYVVPADLLPESNEEREKDAVRCEAKWAEMHFACRLWREQFRTVTCLSLNMRTTGVLLTILNEMRVGKLSDASWRALQVRVLGVSETADGSLQDLPRGIIDPRLQRPPFSTSRVAYIVHRHNLRACQSYCNAVRSSLQTTVRLYVSIAADEAKENAKNLAALTDDVRSELLRENNLRKVPPTATPVLSDVSPSV